MSLKKKIIITVLIVLLGIASGVGILYATNKKPSVTLSDLEQEKKKKEVHVYLNADNDIDYDPILIDCSKETNIDIIPEKEGYTFLGWFYESGEVFVPTTTCEDIFLYARWEDEPGNVETNTNEQSSNNKTNNSKTSNNQKKSRTDTTKTATVYIKYDTEDAPKYYRDMGTKSHGSCLDMSGSLNNCNLKTLLANFKVEDYTGFEFLGLYLDGKKYNNQDLIIKQDTTLEARWKASRYTITFDSNGGNSVSNIDCKAEDKIILPNAPTKSGYTFLGWKCPSCEDPYNTYLYMPKSEAYCRDKKSYKAEWAKSSSGKYSVVQLLESIDNSHTRYAYDLLLMYPELDTNTKLIIYKQRSLSDGSDGGLKEIVNSPQERELYNTAGGSLSTGYYYIDKGTTENVMIRLIDKRLGIDEVISTTKLYGKYFSPKLSIESGDLIISMEYNSLVSNIELYSSDVKDGEYTLEASINPFDSGHIYCTKELCRYYYYPISNKYYKARFIYNNYGNNEVSEFSNIVHK